MAIVLRSIRHRSDDDSMIRLIDRYTKLMGDVWAYEPPLLLTRLTAIGGKLSEMKGEMNNMNDTESRAWNLSPGSISRPSSKVGVVQCYSRPEGEPKCLPAPVQYRCNPPLLQ